MPALFVGAVAIGSVMQPADARSVMKRRVRMAAASATVVPHLLSSSLDAGDAR
jgi:hypothetical protein